MDSIPRNHKSIISNEPKCYHCGSEYDLQRHHVYMGVAYRWKAERDGLWINLCADCHRYIHSKDGHNLSVQYKQIAERAWLKHYNKTIADFRHEYGKNWL